MRLRNIKNAHDIINSCPYVIKDYLLYKGKMNSIFEKNNPIYIEIGCGKGDFIIESAIKNPNINFIGIEKQASVLVSVIKKLKEIDIPNLKIICMDAKDVDNVFENEVDKIYLNFSDPWPKNRHSDRRLTSHIFLKKYDSIFKGDKIIEMKTDNKILFQYSLMSLSQYNYILEEVYLDLYESLPEDNIQTEYEKKFVSKNMNIYKLKATVKKSVK